MSDYEKEKLSKIEELKQKLYNKSYTPKLPHRDEFPHFKEVEVVDSWKDEDDENHVVRDKFFMQSSVFKKFFIFSLSFFVFAAIYAGYMFFGGSNTVSNENIIIDVRSEAFTEGGEDYSLVVQVTNRNASSLDLVDLVVEYPKRGGSDVSEEKERMRVQLGTIPSGGVRSEHITLFLFGEAGSKAGIKIFLEYRLEGSNAIFVKEKPYEVLINSTPLDLSMELPSETSTNQEIQLDVNALLNAQKSLSGILLKIDYPIGFQFIKAIPAPDFGNNVWKLGDLPPGAERKISVYGSMIDVFDGEQKVFRATVGTSSTTNKFEIGSFLNSTEEVVAIRRPSIGLEFTINNASGKEFAVNSKNQIEGRIKWTNNLTTNINNAEIKVFITGNAIDRKSVVPRDGFYNSTQNSIIWDRNSLKDLASISPGETGTVSFALSSLSIFGPDTGIIFSPIINLSASVEGREERENSPAISFSNKESKIIRIISDVSLSSKAFYYASPFKNKGPIPPKAETKTTYTITWSVINTSNNLSKAEVHAKIPVWVKFTGVVFPALENLSYNEETREISWIAGNVPRGAGLGEITKQVSFQLELTPSLSQLGANPVLIEKSFLTAHDDFANVGVKASKEAVDTRLLYDPSFPSNGSRVVE